MIHTHTYSMCVRVCVYVCLVKEHCYAANARMDRTIGAVGEQVFWWWWVCGGGCIETFFRTEWIRAFWLVGWAIGCGSMAREAPNFWMWCNFWLWNLLVGIAWMAIGMQWGDACAWLLAWVVVFREKNRVVPPLKYLVLRVAMHIWALKSGPDARGVRCKCPERPGSANSLFIETWEMIDEYCAFRRMWACQDSWEQSGPKSKMIECTDLVFGCTWTEALSPSFYGVQTRANWRKSKKCRVVFGHAECASPLENNSFFHIFKKRRGNHIFRKITLATSIGPFIFSKSCIGLFVFVPHIRKSFWFFSKCGIVQMFHSNQICSTKDLPFATQLPNHNATSKSYTTSWVLAVAITCCIPPTVFQYPSIHPQCFKKLYRQICAN